MNGTERQGRNNYCSSKNRQEDYGLDDHGVRRERLGYWMHSEDRTEKICY